MVFSKMYQNYLFFFTRTSQQKLLRITEASGKFSWRIGLRQSLDLYYEAIVLRMDRYSEDEFQSFF